MEMVVLGSISGCPTIWLSIESQMRGARFKSLAARSGIMVQIRLVKTNRDMQDIEHQQQLVRGKEGINESLQHGTKVCGDLVQPWAHFNHLVCADSFFASLHTAEKLMNLGLRYIGVVKWRSKVSGVCICRL
jgi:hypothetical protein